MVVLYKVTYPRASADWLRERPVTEIQETLFITIQYMSSTYFMNFPFNKHGNWESLRHKWTSDKLVIESNWGYPFLFCRRRKRRWSVFSSPAGKWCSLGGSMVEGKPHKAGSRSPGLWSPCTFTHHPSQPGLRCSHSHSDWVFPQHQLFKYLLSWFLLYLLNISLSIFLYLTSLAVTSQVDVLIHIKIRSSLM